MTDQRYKDLMWTETEELTQEEIAQGWHFCLEFDGLLIGPGWSELSCCHCLPGNHPIYETAPPEKSDLIVDIFPGGIDLLEPTSIDGITDASFNDAEQF